ncbi:MAG: cell division protein FtsL [Clostridia bacterium]|nr:cell division protein FtsL [Clostridia bacterium]
MNAAQDWSRYEEEYKRYGLDMRPAPSADDPAVKRKKIKKENAKPELRVTTHDRNVMISLVLAIAVCMIAIIFFRAYAANINYKISSLNQQIEALNDDIDNLNVKLKTGSSLDQIEAYAVSNLGMGYPNKDNNVDVTELENTDEVNAYIKSLAASQRGLVVNSEITVSDAAKRLFDRG